MNPDGAQFPPRKISWGEFERRLQALCRNYQQMPFALGCQLVWLPKAIDYLALQARVRSISCASAPRDLVATLEELESRVKDKA